MLELNVTEKQNRPNKKILITGATGFIGSHWVDDLVKRGYRVTCLVRDGEKLGWLSPDSVKIVVCDLTDINALSTVVNDVDLVIHVAALGLRKLSFNPSFNVMSTLSLLMACTKCSSIEKFIFVSSVKADTKNSQANAKINNESMDSYRQSKYQCEQIVKRFCTNYGINFSILRLPAVFGPRDMNFLPLFKTVQHGVLPLVVGKQNLFFSSIYIHDLIDCLHATLFHSTNDVLEIDNPDYLTWNQFVRVIQSVFGRRTKLIIPVNGLYMLTRAWGCFRGNLTIRLEDICKNSWKFSGSSRPFSVENHSFISLEQTVHETITWYKQQGLI